MKVLFVCHGNICRSQMAHMIFNNLKRDTDYVDSAGTSAEESGNTIYYLAEDILTKKHIPIIPHQARQIKKEDYNNFDLIIAMERINKVNIERIFGIKDDNKIKLLLDYTNYQNKDISDPWYTRDFDTCFNLIYEGCVSLIESIKKGE